MEEIYKRIAAYEGQEITEAVDRILDDPEFARWLYGTTSKRLPKAVRALIRLRLKHSDNPRKVVDRYLVYPFMRQTKRASIRKLEITGMENLEHTVNGKPHGQLFLTNHRDIILDAALLAFLLDDKTGLRLYIGVGNNLFGKQWIEDLMRTCGCFAVIRDGNPRDLLDNSAALSAYIADRQHAGRSLWLAQREGRAKDGDDRTQPALLKMLTLAGKGSVFEELKKLHITPVSISYEYDPCDYLKARELQLKRDMPDYVKTTMEDMQSMQIGLCEMKGEVTYNITPCINDELDELAKTAADLPRNEQLRLSAELIDKHIFQGYNLAWTNIAAKEMLDGYEDEKFEIYLQDQLDKIKMPKGVVKDIPFLRERILELYANPAINQQKCFDFSGDKKEEA